MAEMDQDLKHAVEALQVMEGWALTHRGGYPTVICNDIPGYTIVADPVEDDHEIVLSIYPNAKLVGWHQRALDWLSKEPNSDISTAMSETWREGDTL